MDNGISGKTNRVLNIVLLCLLLILIRVWHLDVVQHEKQVEQAHKPQRRLVLEPIERATIRDRFGIPLAVNKMQYNAAICYAHIREIPATSWKRNTQGAVVRLQPRLEHIAKLAALLGDELGIDPLAVEDTIHGKASLFPHTPFVIKEGLSEEQYFRLRMMEKDWLGLQTERASKRWYPLGKVGCDVLGYLGAMSQKKYFALAEEVAELEEYLAARDCGETPFLPKGFDTPLQVRERLFELQEKTTTINDWVGKAGVEAFYEEELRGFHGKKLVEVDVKGNFIRKLPISRQATPGKRLHLTISAELQQFAEQLLAAREGEGKYWMKGGAIVAMIPESGEVIAMASYPRFDPNDFQQEKEDAVQKWLENSAYIGEIWDGKRSLQREYFSFIQGRFIEESRTLSWPLFLDAILPSGPLRQTMDRIGNIATAYEVQEAGIYHPLMRSISLEEDKMLIVDLTRLALPDISPLLLEKIGSHSIADHFLLRQAAMRVQSTIKKEIRELFHDLDFTAWRTAHFKEHLKQKRKEEREGKKFTRPYTEYLDAAEKKLFHAFWEAYRSIFLYMALCGSFPIEYQEHPHLQPYLAHLAEKKDSTLRTLLKSMTPQVGLAYLQTLRSFEELNRPLLGHYRRLRKSGSLSLEKDLAAAFYPPYGYGYLRSQAYRQTSAQGSVFKLVTAYAALLQRLQSNASNLNPLTLIDDLKGDPKSASLNQELGTTLDGRPILRTYKGGLLPRSSHRGIGKIDLVGALEQSSNLYFALLASDHLQEPFQLADAARLFNFGEKTGIDLPGEVAGNIPDDLANNRSGLYAFAIGQHALVVTPLQTAVMMATIANEGKVVQPHIVQKISGKMTGSEEESFYSFQDPLSLVGIHFPLFIATEPMGEKEYIYMPSTEIKRLLPFPKEIHEILNEGMRKAVTGMRGTARPAIMRPLYDHPAALREYYEIYHDLLAKTGTAQFSYKQSIDASTPAEMNRNVWFAAISNPNDKPELVVVVFLRHGEAGREGGPMAAQIIKRWREISAQRGTERQRESLGGRYVDED